MDILIAVRISYFTVLVSISMRRTVACNPEVVKRSFARMTETGLKIYFSTHIFVLRAAAQ